MLSSVLASSAVALAGLLVAAPASVDALVTPGSGSELGHLAARHLGGVSPNHHALARRKRNVHKNRKRCQQRPVSSPSSTPAPQQTDYSGGNDGSGGDNGSNNNNNGYTSNTPVTTQPSTTPPPPSSGDGKLILAWPNGPEDSVPKYFTGKAKYYYTWSPWKVPSNTGNVKFCPMLWGDKQIGDFTSLVVPGYADCVLAMNEPNEGTQSNMDVAHGVWLWNTYIGPLASQGYQILGSPAPTSAPNGLVWVQEWLSQVSVKPNVICLHWYDVGFEKFQSYVQNFHDNTGSRTIWVTEFACHNFNGGDQCSMDQIWEFVTKATQWMDQTDWVGGYAPFGFMREMQGVNELNRLMNYDGSPTDLGNYFIYSS